MAWGGETPMLENESLMTGSVVDMKWALDSPLGSQDHCTSFMVVQREKVLLVLGLTVGSIPSLHNILLT